MPNPITGIGQIAINTNDVQQAVAFYRNGLGLDYLFEAGGLVVADNVLSHSETLAAYSANRQADPLLSSVTVPLDRGLELSLVLGAST